MEHFGLHTKLALIYFDLLRYRLHIFLLTSLICHFPQCNICVSTQSYCVYNGATVYCRLTTNINVVCRLTVRQKYDFIS